jgi:hypothetical protein
LGGADGGDWLANLDCCFGLVHRLVFADAVWLATRLERMMHFAATFALFTLKPTYVPILP